MSESETSTDLHDIPTELSLLKNCFFGKLEGILCFFLKNKLLPEYFPFIKLVDAEPKIEDVIYYKVKYLEGKEEYLMVHASLDYFARDGAIKMSCHGFPILFKQFRIKGKIRIALMPFKTNPISFGGIQFSFIETPLISYRLNVTALPFRRLIDNKMISFINSKMVFPGRVIIPISSMDPMKYRSFIPIGLFALRLKRLTVGEEHEVGPCSSCFGRRQPLSYHTQVSLGTSMIEFEMPKDTDIEEEKWCEFLLEVFQGHQVMISLIPFGGKAIKKTNSKELLGHLSFDVMKELGGEENRFKKLEATKKLELIEEGVLSLLSIDMIWLPTEGAPGEDTAYSGPTVALFCIYIYSCNNLVESEGEDSEIESCPDTFIELSSGGEDDFFSCIYRSHVVLNSRQPEFNYEIIIKCNRDWMTKNISLTVCKDSPDGKYIYGGINLCLADIEKAPIVRDVRSINSKVPYSTMTLSASIKKLIH
ncbi:uncharacterized protein [Lepeophtheirus salmonis]|uniref:uncharacterized protein n=1 Tax=Lepeophtheirus salmonis TaxID=72036 RepID=UPI001AE5EAAD|nr:uncharacterized protein LOC121122702 [Lepeophtheirus salmonis]